MQKNRLEGVHMFNGPFWHRSCFYHELMFAVGAFDIDGRELLLEDFIFYGKNFSIKSEIMPRSKLYKSMGFYLQHINVPDVETTVKYIDKGFPLLIGVDTFYYTARDDYYGKHHSPHFVLVYGYDIEKQTFDIIDHEYNNSFVFKEREWDAGDILNASREYADGICLRKHTSILVKPCAPTGERFVDRIAENPEMLDKSAENFDRDMRALKKIMESGENILLKYSKKLSEFFYSAHRKRACIAESILGEKSENLKRIAKELSEIHAFFRALFLKVEWWKDVRFIDKHKDVLFSKLEELRSGERKLFEEVKKLL